VVLIPRPAPPRDETVDPDVLAERAASPRAPSGREGRNEPFSPGVVVRGPGPVRGGVGGAVRDSGRRVDPVLVEMCILLSRGAFRPRDVRFALENDGWNCTFECEVHVSAPGKVIQGVVLKEYRVRVRR